MRDWQRQEYEDMLACFSNHPTERPGFVLPPDASVSRLDAVNDTTPIAVQVRSYDGMLATFWYSNKRDYLDKELADVRDGGVSYVSSHKSVRILRRHDVPVIPMTVEGTSRHPRISPFVLMESLTRDQSMLHNALEMVARNHTGFTARQDAKARMIARIIQDLKIEDLPSLDAIELARIRAVLRRCTHQELALVTSRMSLGDLLTRRMETDRLGVEVSLMEDAALRVGWPE